MNIFWMMGFAFVYILIGYVVTVLIEYCDAKLIVNRMHLMLAWPLFIIISFVVVIVLTVEWLMKKLSGGSR